MSDATTRKDITQDPVAMQALQTLKNLGFTEAEIRQAWDVVGTPWFGAPTCKMGPCEQPSVAGEFCRLHAPSARLSFVPTPQGEPVTFAKLYDAIPRKIED